MGLRPGTQDRELYLRIKTILVLRVAFLTGFVVTIFFFQKQYPYNTPIIPLSLTLALAYSLSALYALLLRLEVSLFVLSVCQVLGDLVVVGTMIFCTGGIDSPLSFLYSLVIIASSVMLPRAATFLVASVAGISYGLILDLEYYGILRPIYFFSKSTPSEEGGYVFFIIFLNIVSYYAVAYLSSLLSHRLSLMKEQLQTASSNLEKLQMFHKNVVLNMGNGLLTTDLNGRITSMNPSAERITGVPIAEGIGKFCFDLIPIETLSTLFQELQHTSPPDYIEGICKRSDHQQAFIRIKMSRLHDDTGDTPGFIFVFEDLTEIREMQDKMAQAEQLAAVGRFSAGLAHEIRNPLASLSGSIQVLKNGMDLKGSDRDLMEIVERETDRLNRIVSDFLHFANPRKSRRTLFDLQQSIEEVILLMKNSSEYQSNTSIEFEHESARHLAYIDEQQFKQMIWNLCLNGMQAMDYEGVLKIGLRNGDGFQHQNFKAGVPGWVITVRDSGCGISQEDLANIYDPFFTTKENGVGLGLARVRQIVEDNGGYVGIDSELNKGTQFTIFFPQADLPISTPAGEPSSAGEGTGS